MDEKQWDELVNFGGFADEGEFLNFINKKMKLASNVWQEMHRKNFFEKFGELVRNEETLMDAYCYFIVSQNVSNGSIVDMPYMPGLVPEDVKEQLQDTSLEVSSLLINSITLRSLMLSAMMYGVWWKQNLNNLDKLWDNGAIDESSS